MNGPVTLSSVIASNMRRIRLARGLLQEDIATTARWVGLKWSSVTVTQIESQSRLLGLEEFLLLPLVLRCSLRDLLIADDPRQPIQLGFNTVLDASTVAELVSTDGPQLKDGQVPMLPGLETRLDPKIKTAIYKGGLEPTLLSYLKVREGARGEAERKAAQTLKISAVNLTAYSLRLWGRPLTEERDARAAEEAGKGKQARAVRGHITRALLRDLQDEDYLRYKAIEERDDEGPPVKLKPASADERALRKISIHDYERDTSVRKGARGPYERWMRSQIIAALDKKGPAR